MTDITPETHDDHDATARRAIVEEMWADLRAGRLRPVEYYAAKHPAYEGVVYAEHQRLLETLASPFGDGAASSSGAQAPSQATEPLEQERKRVGRWTLQRELGKGGQGSVWLAEDEQLGQRAAVKLLNPGTLSEDVLARFRREANIMARLDDPALCGVYAAGFQGRTPYIAMRYVEGETLAARIRGAAEGRAGDIAGGRPKAGDDDTLKLRRPEQADDVRLEPPQAPPSGAAGAGTTPSARTPSSAPAIAGILAIVEEVARALHVLHEAGVVHRDVKPRNIMVTPAGAPVLLDLGLARDRSEEAPTLTQTGVPMGTPGYMSPEQLDGAELDRRTDVYSLGVTLFECLTLRLPFSAATAQARDEAIRHASAPDARRLNRAVGNDLKIVLDTALEKDPARRYATAADFAEDLRRVRLREPIRARPVGRMTKLVRWAQRKPALATALCSLFVVLAAGLAFSLFYLDQATTERNAKSAALADYDRLGDVSRLTRLLAEAEGLWPAQPSKKPAMERWLEEAVALEKNLPGHRAVRDALRASPDVLPYSDAAQAADAAQLQPVAERREVARKRRGELVAALAAAESRATAGSAATSAPATRAESRTTVAELQAELATLNAELATLDARLQERLTWRFATEAAQFKHDTIRKLAADIETFLDPDPFVGAVASVRKRLAFAVAAEESLAKTHAARWAAAIASVADTKQCPEYGELKLSRQYGLVPIRQDPQSGLWEFAHLQTTADGVDPIPVVRSDERYDLQETTGLIFVLIPGGTFQMGARRPTAEEAEDAAEGEPLPPNVDPAAEPRESPVHAVTLAPYFLSKYEMTQGQWRRLVGRNPSYFGAGIRYADKTPTLLHPVEAVGWADCAGERGWIVRLGLELPTEAQWEYACRAKTTTPWWTGGKKEAIVSGANVADRFARMNGAPLGWLCEGWNDGYFVHAPIGMFAPNGFGLHDTLGNVSEWCRDIYTGYAADNWRQDDGLRNGASSHLTRVSRGGCFGNDASNARSAGRIDYVSENRLGLLGVRPSRRVEP